MAQKRMFSLSVVDTDSFLEMPISARLLYYELGMRADDDGFVDNWRKILTFTGLKDDDMKLLIVKNFIIPFESGVIVIRHWRMNNYLRNDRHKATKYQKELNQLNVDCNDVYTLDTIGIPTDNQLDTIGIHSIDKNSIDKNNKKEEIYKEERSEDDCYASKHNRVSISIFLPLLSNVNISNSDNKNKIHELFKEYIEVRNKKKYIVNETIIKRLINKLNDYGKTDKEKIEIIENAINGAWKDFYELKEEKKEYEQQYTIW